MSPKRAPLNLADTGLTGPSIRTATDARPPLGIVGALTTAAIGGDQTSARVGDIADNPSNPRTQLGDLTDLAASIAASGLVQPVIVATAAAWHQHHPGHSDALGGKPWVLIAGHRRLAAAKLAGVDSLPITARDHLAGATTESALIENIHRQDLAPLDEAVALDDLLSGGLSQRQLAKITGISQPKISKRLALLRLPDDAKADMADGALTVTDALRLLELPAELHQPVYQQSRDHAYDLDQAISITQSRLAAGARDQKLVEQAVADGLRIIVSPDAEFGSGSSYAHHLWEPADIDRAKQSGICLAHIIRGRVEYYATTPKPWPWATDDRDNDMSAAREEQLAAANQLREQREAETRTRRTAIVDYLHQHTTATRKDAVTERFTLLARLTVLTIEPTGYEDHELVGELLQTAPFADWDTYVAAGISVAAKPTAAHTADPQTDLVLLALARQFALAEEFADNTYPASAEPARAAYLAILSEYLGYIPNPDEAAAATA